MLQFLCDVKDMGKEASLFALDWGEDRGHLAPTLWIRSMVQLQHGCTKRNMIKLYRLRE